jgi:hypothetical protein
VALTGTAISHFTPFRHNKVSSQMIPRTSSHCQYIADRDIGNHCPLVLLPLSGGAPRRHLREFPVPDGFVIASTADTRGKVVGGRVVPSLLDCLGRVRRVQAQAASRAWTWRPQPEGWQLSRMTEEQGTAVRAGRTTVRRAINLGNEGSLAVTRWYPEPQVRPRRSRNRADSQADSASLIQETLQQQMM